MNTIITETTEQGVIAIDIFSKLANDRIFFINNYVDDKVAADLCAALLLKDVMDNSEKISIFINSEKGDIRAVFMIYDTIKILKSPIETICIGTVMDEIVLLLAAGTKGMRYATENSMIGINQLIHDKSYYSNLTDAKSVLDRSIQDNKDFMKALAKSTGRKISDISKNLDRKQFLTAKQAIKYGLIDATTTKNQ